MSGGPPKARAAPLGKYSAARSHELNDKYMEDFEKAWNEMHALNMGGAPGALPAAGPGPLGPRPGTGSSVRPGGAPVTNVGRAAANVASKFRMNALERFPMQVKAGFRKGPEDPAGIMADISDRPTLCSAANWRKTGGGEVVFGSSDHALYIIDAEKGTKKRQLYNKTSGHTEWVTAVAITPDGKVVSGGMDSKLWMWPTGQTRGVQMEGHFGPIAKVRYVAASDLVASASYDKSVRLWQLGARAHEVGALMGHEAPVLEMEVAADGKIITGDRSGHIILWDTSASDVSWRMKNVHQGHITALTWFEEDDVEWAGTFVSGGQDGYVRVWDPRSSPRSNPAKVQLHVNEQGRGAVGNICAGGAAAGNMLVTAGADGTVRVLEPRKSFSLVHTITLTNFPYSLAVAGGIALAGCGDGSLHFIDIKEGKTLYGLGVNKGAVRCIEVCEDRVMTSGDDGNVILHKFA